MPRAPVELQLWEASFSFSAYGAFLQFIEFPSRPNIYATLARPVARLAHPIIDPIAKHTF
jgi:hypothetical protein